MADKHSKFKLAGISLAVLLVLGSISGAAYLGYLQSRAQASPEVPPPPTVAVSTGDVQLSVTAPGQVVATAQTVLNAPVAGQVELLAVKAGQVVTRGQVLARLGSRETFESNLSAAQVSVLQAQQALDDLYAQATTNRTQAVKDIATYEQAVKEAQYQLDNFTVPANMTSLTAPEAVTQMKTVLDQARLAFEPVKYRSETDPARKELKSALDGAQADYSAAVKRLQLEYNLQVAQANLTQALDQLSKWKDGPAATKLALAQANLSKAQQDVQQAQANLENLEVRAPFAGVVLSVDARAGQDVLKGAGLITMTDPQALEVRATVVEEDFPMIQPGQAAQFAFDALPDAQVTGVVTRLVPQRTSDTQAIYPIYLSLGQVPEHLIAGMTTDASIIIAKRTGVLRLPRAVVHAPASDTAQVLVWSHGQTEKRMVKVGLRGDSFVEILSGLAAGELVVAQ